jgi:ubiquinone/menaquinone biosynthesis C-methylase UbiE
MTELIGLARKIGWKEALYKCNEYGVLKRKVVQSILPDLNGLKILDIGCALGTISCELAKICDSVISMDIIPEYVEFLNIRKKQDRINNIHLAHADMLDLPFSDCSFDIVIMNGVLEYAGRRNGLSGEEDKRSPTYYQQKTLREVNRVLKKDGVLYLAIENRYGLLYFRGASDVHVKLKYTTLLPRKLANLYTKIRKGEEYRTYTYSYNGYKKLLQRTGFTKVKFYAPLNSYYCPQITVPLEKDEKLLVEACISVGSKYLTYLARLNIGKWFVPAYIMIAQK